MKFASRLSSSLFILTLLVGNLVSFAAPIPVTSAADRFEQGSTAALPSESEFIQSVENGNANELVGVYVADTLAYPVLQQPSGSPAFVSTQADVVTQFGMAADYNTTGLLAHNYLAGEQFFALQPDQIVTLVYGDGSTQFYEISDIQQYQALSPRDPYSEFIDLNDASQTHLSSSDLFSRTYALGNMLIFQTCIQNGKEDSWGRLFVLANPITAEQAAADDQPQVALIKDILGVN